MNIKKIIAKEALFFLGLFCLPLLVMLIYIGTRDYNWAAISGWFILAYPIYSVIKRNEVDNKKVRRILIREGLIFLGLVVIPYLIGSMWWLGPGIWIIGWLAVIYPFYLVIRFIFWAIKTLKENKE